MRKTALILALLILGAFVFASEVDTYCYEQLSRTEQIAYQAIKDCVTHMIGSWNCGSMTQNSIQRAYESLLMDHPEYYWVDHYTYVTSYVNNMISGHRVEFSYSMDVTQILKRNEEITQALYTMVDSLVIRDNSTFAKVKSVFDYLVDNCTYDELNLDQSLYSVMVNKSGVCASFSKAFEFAMQCLGIPCTVVYGRLTVPEGVLGTTLGHEWNCVFINDSWYHVDITSALAVDKDENQSRYRFLCISTDEILRTHVIENPVPIPDCPNPYLSLQ